MATQTLIQLKYSTVTSVPATLSQSEPAYSFISNKLFIGTGSTVVAIGGQFYTGLLDANTSYATPGTIVVRDSVGSSQFNGILANTISSNTTIYAGISYAAPLGGATNPLMGSDGNANNYVQNYVRNVNNGLNASSDWIAYPDNGTDTNGWIDMGIGSSTYGDPRYNVSGPNEGYILMSAPAGSGTSGNLVFGTDSTGTYNDIVFQTGSLTSGYNPLMHLRNGQGLVIDITTSSSSNSSGALVVKGGVGVKGAVYADTLYDGGSRVISVINTNSGPGITVSNSKSGNTDTITINNTGVISLTANTGDVTSNATTGNIVFGLVTTAVTAGTYGGTTQIPTITVDAKGRITFAGNNTVATSFTVSGNTGSGTQNGGGTLTIQGNGTGIVSTVTGSGGSETVTLSHDSTVLRSNTTTVGTQTITSDLIISGNVTLLNPSSSFNVQSTTVATGDSLIKLAANNFVGDVIDIGFYGQSYTGSSLAYHGLVREGINGTKPGDFYLFQNLATDPTGNVVNYASLQSANLNAGIVKANSTYASNGSVSTGIYNGAYTDGIILDYSTGNGRISVGGSDGITLYNNADSTRNALLAISSTGNITTGVWQATAITASYGGTGLSSVANNTIVYGSGSTAFNTLAIGSNTQVLMVNSTGSPVWGSINLNSAAVNGVLPATSGGTGQSSYTIGDILYASTSSVVSKLAAGTSGYALIANGAGVAPSYQQVSLTAGVSGTLPVSSGGTSSSSFTANGVVISSTTTTGALTAVSGSAYQVLQLSASGIPVFSGLNGGTF